MFQILIVKLQTYDIERKSKEYLIEHRSSYSIVLVEYEDL